MLHITDELLLESYQIAKKRKLDQDFLVVLESEIRKRIEQTQTFLTDQK